MDIFLLDVQFVLFYEKGILWLLKALIESIFCIFHLWSSRDCHQPFSDNELVIRSGANLDLKDYHNKTAFDILNEDGGNLSQEEKTRLKDLPRLIKQEQAQQQQQQQRNQA